MLQQLFDATVLASIYTLFAVGMSLAWGILGILNLAHGAVLMTSAFAAYVWADDRGASLWSVLLVGLVVGGVLSLILEAGPFCVIRRSGDEHEAIELRTIIASLGISSILVALVANQTSNAPFSIDTAFEAARFEVLGVRVGALQLLIIGVGLGISALLAVFLRRSRQGRALRALESDPETALLMGISAPVLSSGTMFVSGALAGLAGVLLVVYLGATEPAASHSLLTTAFAVIVVGGVGSVGGAVVGAIALAVLETLVISNTSGAWSPAVAFAFIILVLLFRPQGLFASSRTKVDRV